MSHMRNDFHCIAAHSTPKFARLSSRRDFLKQAGAGSLLLATKGLAAQSSKNILVLGAGAAGLTAALALKKQGYQVTILEYQNRIGGRLWSKELKGGQFTELGAGHFAYDGMPLTNGLVNRYKLARLKIYDGVPRYVMNAQQGHADQPESWPQAWGLNEFERQNRLGPTLISYLNKAGITDMDAALSPSWPDAAAVTRYGDVTVKKLLKDQGASDGFINLLNVHLGSFAADGDILDGLTSLIYFFSKKTFFRVEGGNEQIAQAMADEFGRHSILLNTKVIDIDQTGSQVKVTASDGRIFKADQVVCTIPFSVIREMKVQPAWSPGKIRLFDEMKWIDNFKGVIQTQTNAWLKQGNIGWPVATTDQAWNRVIDITGNEKGGHGNVFFYVYRPEKLAQLKAITSADKITARTELLLKQFNDSLNTAGSTTTPRLTNNLIDINQVITKDSIMWADAEDVPWIKAALGVGVKPWMRDEWSVPEGRIHFAGDFTSYKSGWVEGALESGLRAAAEINPQATTI